MVIGVIGLAGLFSSCLDAVGRIQSYQTFTTDSNVLYMCFNAARVLFERWGTEVGIERTTVSADRHPYLKDENLRLLVQQVLTAINSVIDESNGNGEDDSMAKKDSTERRLWWRKDSHRQRSSMSFNLASDSRTFKVQWALGGKAQREVLVTQFEILVERLQDLVPPYPKASALTAPGDVGAADLPEPGTKCYHLHLFDLPT